MWRPKWDSRSSSSTLVVALVSPTSRTYQNWTWTHLPKGTEAWCSHVGNTRCWSALGPSLNSGDIWWRKPGSRTTSSPTRTRSGEALHPLGGPCGHALACFGGGRKRPVPPKVRVRWLCHRVDALGLRPQQPLEQGRRLWPAAHHSQQRHILVDQLGL